MPILRAMSDDVVVVVIVAVVVGRGAASCGVACWPAASVTNFIVLNRTVFEP